MKKNYMFDIAMEIETEKEFHEITMDEFLAATLKRLREILKANNLEAFGEVDSYDVD